MGKKPPSPLLLSEVYFQKIASLSLLESSIPEIMERGEDLAAIESPGGWDFDDLMETFELVYELEYKYNMIASKPFKGLEQRKHNILEILERIADKLIISLSKTFEVVFEDWLDKHALLEPKRWAQARIDDVAQSFDESDEYIWGFLASEYERYKFPDRNKPSYVVLSALMNDTRENLDKMPDMKELVSIYSRDEKNILYDELEYDGPEELGERFGKEFTDEWEARDFIDNYEPDPVDSLVLQDSSSFENAVLGSNDWNVFRDIWEHVVFPLWFEYWKAQGIEKTRSTVENAYNMIGQLAGMPIKQKFGALNHIKNVNHQGGSMMEYYDERYGIGEVELHTLSRQETEEWNKELREIGVEI